uniref:Uncharacterized protein n=1 Tax=viral metagenome TaxID=1070528 RepID=A0A6M3LZR8_9ZZZZ
MSHGQPDFGAYAAKVTVGSLADMAELAARLGSIVTLDRRGDVIFFDDFEAPILNWTGKELGVGHEERLYPDKAFMGSQSVYLDPGGEMGDSTFIVRRFHATPNQCYGLEARKYQVLANAYFNITIWIYTDSKVYKAHWVYNSEEEKLFILDSGGEEKEIAANIKTYRLRDEWFPTKLVIDSLNWKYVRGLFLGKEYDLSDELMEEDTTDVPPCIELFAGVDNVTGTPTGVLYDNIILTQNEP